MKHLAEANIFSRMFSFSLSVERDSSSVAATLSPSEWLHDDPCMQPRGDTGSSDRGTQPGAHPHPTSLHHEYQFSRACPGPLPPALCHWITEPERGEKGEEDTRTRTFRNTFRMHKPMLQFDLENKNKQILIFNCDSVPYFWNILFQSASCHSRSFVGEFQHSRLLGESHFRTP